MKTPTDEQADRLGSDGEADELLVTVTPPPDESKKESALDTARRWIAENEEW